MSQNHQDEKVVSRRTVIKGGAASLAGAFAMLAASRRGDAAVTSLDRAFTTSSKAGGGTVKPMAVTPMDRGQ